MNDHNGLKTVSETVSRLLLALLVSCLLLSANYVMAAESDASITLNFKDSDIREVATSVGEITGKNFIIDPRVKGRVTMVSARRISLDAVYATFLSVLQVHGFAAVTSGDIIKIIPAVDARPVPGAESRTGAAPADDVITRVIEVHNVPAAQLVPILRPLIPQFGHLAAYPGSNMLIISDRAANVDRIVSIIRRIDQSSDEEIEIIPLQNAPASETVRVLSALLQSTTRGAGIQAPVLVADDRTNSILVGGDKTQRLRLRALITHLDTPLAQGGDTQVVYLRYADSQAISEILKTFVSEGVEAAGESDATRGIKAVIIPDTATNALVINAPGQTMRSIMGIIEKLDIRRAQVLVEAIIVEIASDKASELGITWILDGTPNEHIAGLTNFAGSGTGAIDAVRAFDDNDFSGIGDGLSLGFGRINRSGVSFVGLLRALAGDSRTNILSTPTLVTLDNEEAEIKVGQEVPFVTGSFTSTGAAAGSVNPFQTIQRQEVGVSLKVTPKINAGDSVILKIEQEVSSISESADAVDIITNKRTINTNVIAENREIIVLGGLIDDFLTETEQRVPVLGAIPILGNLFKFRTTRRMKRNLMVFLHAIILRSQQDAAIYTNSKYNYIRSMQSTTNKGRVQLMPKEKRPILPPLKGGETVHMERSAAAESLDSD
ncbi:MAG: type II secretion system secretin GspD [Gammaproteobacteria bacterium]